MSNIDKQALREIAAAAVGAHERLSVMPPDDIFDISLAEGTQLDADITALNALNSAANPATVLALLASLEAAEKRIAELEAKLDSADKLQDSAFRHGLQHGFSFGQTDNQAGFEECLSAYGARGKDNG
ncbi:putative bacteriophage protein [Escherichia coli]|nr:ead/Ea22-like family protein [Escherichia coli]STI23896.1 putative bacteriophage protein [Escherichia coli]HAI2326694.1 ead/Ea22-like family protein [Escherichia coli]